MPRSRASIFYREHKTEAKVLGEGRIKFKAGFTRWLKKKARHAGGVKSKEERWRKKILAMGKDRRKTHSGREESWSQGKKSAPVCLFCWAANNTEI